MIVMASFLTMMATTSSPQSSWPPHPHASSREVWEIGNAWIQAGNTLGRETLYFFRVKWLPWSPKEGHVSAGARLDPGKRSAKCARDCSKSSVSHKHRKKLTKPAGALLEDEVGKRHTRLARARFPFENVEKLRGSEHFWKMRSAKWGRDLKKVKMANASCIISIIIMSATSSWPPHHHASIVEKCERSGMRELRLENTLGRETLCFSGKVVSAGARLDPEKAVDKMCTRL